MSNGDDNILSSYHTPTLWLNNVLFHIKKKALSLLVYPTKRLSTARIMDKKTAQRLWLIYAGHIRQPKENVFNYPNYTNKLSRFLSMGKAKTLPINYYVCHHNAMTMQI